jgi:hypothetical protein
MRGPHLEDLWVEAGFLCRNSDNSGAFAHPPLRDALTQIRARPTVTDDVEICHSENHDARGERSLTLSRVAIPRMTSRWDIALRGLYTSIA